MSFGFNIRLGTLLLLVATGHAQQQPAFDTPGPSPVSWVQAAVPHEIRIIDDDGSFPVRYRTHRIDAHGEIVRETIECREGTVSRLLLREGKPLTPEEDAAERDRLNAILADPSDWRKHQKRNTSARSYATDLVKLMPQSMIYTYTPGQPQLPNSTSQQIVLDFHPDPAFKPPTTVSEMLTGIEGRMWIDKHRLVLTRVEGHINKPINFGWGGVFAKMYPGGNIVFEQTEAGNGRWIYSFLDENITIREMLVHTAVEKVQSTAFDIHLLPAQISYQEAIKELLAIPLPH